jgi:dienelactone hydrolase
MGQDVALIEYPHAHHGFDARGLPPSRFEPDVISARNCLYVERAPGYFEVSHRDTGRPADPGDPCLSRGITQGYNPRAHQQVVQDVKDFLLAIFAPKRSAG